MSMTTKAVAICLNEQGRFAATRVSDFVFLPELGRHAWRGLICETAEEVAECVNGALKSVIDFRDPFMTIEAVTVEIRNSKSEFRNGEGDPPSPGLRRDSSDAEGVGEKDSLIMSLMATNAELLRTIEQIQRPGLAVRKGAAV